MKEYATNMLLRNDFNSICVTIVTNCIHQFMVRGDCEL